jgi:hypothetical protein
MVAQEQKKLLAKPSKNTQHHSRVSSIVFTGPLGPAPRWVPKWNSVGFESLSARVLVGFGGMASWARTYVFSLSCLGSNFDFFCLRVALRPRLIASCYEPNARKFSIRPEKGIKWFGLWYIDLCERIFAGDEMGRTDAQYASVPLTRAAQR